MPRGKKATKTVVPPAQIAAETFVADNFPTDAPSAAPPRKQQGRKTKAPVSDDARVQLALETVRLVASIMKGGG